MNKLSKTLLSYVSRLPWWLGVVLAAAVFAVLRWYSHGAVGDDGPGPWPGGLRGYMQGLTGVLHYGLPLLLLLASAGSFCWRWKRRGLVTRVAHTPPAALVRLSRDDFAFLVAEYFRHRGFEVEKADIRPGSGADLIAVKGSERYYIRCAVTAEAGVKEVRPLAESVEADDVTGGMAVAAGGFADEAEAFTARTRIRLINGLELHRGIRQQSQEELAATAKKSPVAAALKWSFLVLLILSLWGAALLATEQGRSLTFATLEKFAGTVSLFRAAEQTAAPADILETEGGEEKPLLSLQRLRQAVEKILGGGDPENASEGQKPAPPRYRYEIELHSGGWIHTDDVNIEDDQVTYTSKGGLEIAINRDEIRTLKRVKEKR